MLFVILLNKSLKNPSKSSDIVCFISNYYFISLSRFPKVRQTLADALYLLLLADGDVILGENKNS